MIQVSFNCGRCGPVKVPATRAYSDTMEPAAATCLSCGTEYRFPPGAGWIESVEFAGVEPSEMPSQEITITVTETPAEKPK